MGPGALRVRACMCVYTCVCVRMPVSPLCTCAHIHEWHTWFCMCACIVYISTCVHMCEGIDIRPRAPWVKTHLSYDRDPALAQSSVPGEASLWVSLGAELLLSAL